MLEKEKQFRDRVRGESLAPWGAGEAKELGVCAPRRNGAGDGHWSKSRGGYRPKRAGRTDRCAVGGRSGRARIRRAQMGRFYGAKERAALPVCRGLLTGVACRDDMVTFLFNPDLGLAVGVVPETKQRCRAYLGYPAGSGLVLQGNDKRGSFMSESQKVSPHLGECYAHAQRVGPLATFEASESWVDHPYREGVALLGDAAATSDPTFGQGMSKALRDARVLRDALLANSDWDQTGIRERPDLPWLRKPSGRDRKPTALRNSRSG
jgi:hypothetical protein